MTAAHLVVDSRPEPDGVVLRLTGEIDIATVDQLRDAAAASITNGAGQVVLDFAGVTFCDSQGLSTLITLDRDLRNAGARLVLTNVGDFVGRVLDITGLRAKFEFR